ncbi:hypothetical protein OFB92_33450, partial [Escherichia coli]|nr:hypothetical protein [Escherichia coli]
NEAGIGEPIIQDSLDKKDEVLIKVPLISSDGESGNVDQVNLGRQAVKNALDKFGREAAPEKSLDDDPEAAYKIVGTDSVGPVAGA